MNTDCPSKMVMHTAWIIEMSLLIISVLCSTTKRWRCVEYRKENYFLGGRPLDETRTETEHHCMISCVRRDPCNAFNYHTVNQTCILLLDVECMLPAPDNNSGYVFVHLSACKFQPVYTSVRPTDRNWYWSITDNPNTDVIVLRGHITRYVGRMMYRGCYFPGCWKPGPLLLTWFNFNPSMDK